MSDLTPEILDAMQQLASFADLGVGQLPAPLRAGNLVLSRNAFAIVMAELQATAGLRAKVAALEVVAAAPKPRGKGVNVSSHNQTGGITAASVP